MTPLKLVGLVLVVSFVAWVLGLPRKRCVRKQVLVTAWMYDGVGITVTALVTGAGAFVMPARLSASASLVVVGLVLCLGALVGLPRWRRANGAASPLAQLLSEAGSAAVSYGDDQLRADARMLPYPVLVKLHYADDDAERQTLLCQLLAEQALRTAEAGTIVWLLTDAQGRLERSAMRRLVSVDSLSRDEAIEAVWLNRGK